MCLQNELIDVKPVNLPNLKNTKVEDQEWFVFAGFFPPGYHQCLIYDPAIDRAFCKDFVVQLNKRDFVYPEYPLP